MIPKKIISIHRNPVKAKVKIMSHKFCSNFAFNRSTLLELNSKFYRPFKIQGLKKAQKWIQEAVTKGYHIQLPKRSHFKF